MVIHVDPDDPPTALRDAVAALAASSIGGAHQAEVMFTPPFATADDCTEPVLIQPGASTRIWSSGAPRAGRTLPDSAGIQ